jgi:hypothetical protein
MVMQSGKEEQRADQQAEPARNDADPRCLGPRDPYVELRVKP